MLNRFIQQAARRSFHTTRVLRAGAGKEFKFAIAARQLEQPSKNKFSEWFYRTFLRRTSTYFALMGVLTWTFDYACDNFVESYSLKANAGRSFEDCIRDFPEIPPNCETDEDEDEE